MTRRNGQLATEDSVIALHTIDEQPSVDCKSSLDSRTLDPAANSTVIPHTLKPSNTMALPVSEEKDRPLADNGSIPPSQAQNDHWRGTLAGAPAMLDLPTDRPRASRQSTDVSKIPIHLDAQLTLSLKQVAIEYDMDLSMVVIASWSAVLARLSSEDDIIIGYHDSSQGGPRSNQQADKDCIWPLRLDLSCEPNISQLFERVRTMNSTSMGHRGLPLNGIAEIDSSPLIQVAFRWNNQTSSHSPAPIQFELELQLQEQDNELVGGMLYSSDLFNPDTIERHIGYLVTMLQAITADVNRPVSSVDLLSQVERDLVLGKWNETFQDYPANLCIHHLFEQQVEYTPQATALVFNSQSMSYSELNERANRIAHRLIGLGVQPDSFVAICIGRSFAMIVAVFAVLKAGGAYVPLDPTYPSSRLRDILTDAAPRIVIADESGRGVLGESVLASLAVVDPGSGVALDKSQSHRTPNPQVQDITPNNLAYVIYTSGSTGKPKGVMIEHRGVVNLVHAHTKFCGIHQDSRILQFASLNFDASLWEITLPLSCGASLHLLADSIRQDRDKVWEYMAKHSITHAGPTPLFLQDGKNFPAHVPQLMLVIGGEALDPIQTQNMVAQGYTVLNDYGPTEITISAISWKCPQDFRGDTVPIGRPLANKTVYILDSRQQPVPLGAIGELYIGGTGVARGYLNRPGLTSEVFLRDPFSRDNGARMYKTGDLVRYLPDGNIIFLGRNDHQVKIRGFRIELGEIEARLRDHPLVRSATVIAMGDRGDRRLVAYVVAKRDDQLVHTLRSHLTSCLPDYMVPAAIVRLDSLPINSNGKLDRKALPVPNSESYAHQVYEKPKGDTETVMAKIWAELLHLDRVGRKDNFFALGGHSLLAVQMIEHLRRIGFTLAVSALFKTPTISALVQLLDIGQVCDAPINLIMPDTTTITPEMLPLINLSQADIDHVVKLVPGGVANIQDIYALSPLQEGILFHHLLATEGDPYLVLGIWAFETRELLDKYLDAVQMVVNRHDILRTAILHENLSTPAQVVWRQASLSVTELELDTSNGPIVDQLKQGLDPQRHRIDLTQAPLLKFTIAQDAEGRWVLAELLHHLIGDHTTLETTFNETKAFMDGLGHTLSAPQPFRNLIAQVKVSQNQEDHERFFREMLMDIDTPSLPFGLKDVHGQGHNVATSYQLLPQDLNDRLRRQAKQLGVSVASLCHLAWAQVISKTSGEDRVVFGTVLFGRMNSGQGSDSAMGLFVNTLPLRVDLAGTVHESVLRLHERLASLLDHEHASLVLAQRCSNIPQGAPLFSAILNYRHNATSSDTSSIMESIEFLESQERTNYPFTLSVEDFGGSLGLTANVVQPFSPTRVCGYMQQVLESLVHALEHAPDMITHELNILPDEEQELLIQTWNATEQDYPDHMCIHHLFEQQVERTPQATALVFNGQSLSYTELNVRANRLAHHLIGLGAQPDSLVAICVERSFAMIVGVLGILKAGGAYVPLDPTNASIRLQDILADAAPSIVVADELGKKALGISVLATLTIVDPDTVPGVDSEGKRHSGYTSLTEHFTPNPQITDLTSNHLAYVIFTSGSTGKPKGVMVEHHGVVNLVMSRPDAYGATPTGNVALFPSFSFDSSVVDIFSTLSYGGSLHVLPDDIRMDQIRLWEYLQHHSITQALLPPAILQEFKDLPALHMPFVLVVAGEALSGTLVRTLQEHIPNGRIVNDYGPTEATVSATAWKCPPGFNEDLVPIGQPVANKTIYLLDEHRRPVPLGAIGELYIGGVGIARGYLNHPELTSQVFLPDPFAGFKDARMYKTGDLARYLPDGTIIFLGRNDHQVKIRGFRVELGEIEARLGDHPLVQSAAVVAMGDGGDRRLVAYVVAKHDDQLVHSLRSYLTSCLPDYMVPAAFVRLDDFPLSVNGKLDRLQLPQPDDDAMAHQQYEAPFGIFENTLMTIWMDLLHVDKIGRHDNFFMLGGHSLLAMRMVTQIRLLMGFKVTLGTLFMAPTIAELVPHLLTAGNAHDDAFDVLLPIRPRGMRLPLFCVHHGFGISWDFIGLSKHLHPDQPIYGLQARGFVDGSQFATTIEDMALDYIEQIKRIQPHGPYCLVGYSFGGRVVHTMAVHLERQGERVALLAVMDTDPGTPMTKDQVSIEEQEDEAQNYAVDIHLFVNRIRDALPDGATPDIERFEQVRSNLSRLFKNHTTFHRCNSGMILFRAMDQTPISSDGWKPYVMGDMDVFDIHCGHVEMDLAAPLAEIGGVLAERLNEIHIREMREL